MAKKAASKKAPAKKAAAKKKNTAATKKAPASAKKKAPAKKKVAAKKTAPAKSKAKSASPAKTKTKVASKAKVASKTKAKPKTKTAAKPKVAATKVAAKKAAPVKKPAPAKKKPATHNGAKVKLSPFAKRQRQRLLELHDHMVDAMAGVAQDNLRSRAEGSEASAFGMHQADAGSDAYDRDFALNLLSQEQDALYEIEEAIKRIDEGAYGVCEISGEKIPEARLEAIPFARLTVTCQEQWERQNGGRTRSYGRGPSRSLFGLMDGADTGVDSD